MVTTNEIYRCEEFEDAVSIYDEVEENQYDDLNEQNVYLDVLADDSDGGDRCGKPDLPNPRSGAADRKQSRDDDYEGLKEEKPDHVYLHVLEECDESAEVEGQEESRPQDDCGTTQDRDTVA